MPSGVWCANNFCFKPKLTTQGSADKANFDLGQDRVDAAIGGAWVDYSATSVIVGWSAFTTKKIRYKKVGSLVLVSLYLAGTSDAITATFTLPNACVGGLDVYSSIPYVIDNNIIGYSGSARITSGSTIVALYYQQGTGWTAANGKTAAGQFFYEVAP